MSSLSSLAVSEAEPRTLNPASQPLNESTLVGTVLTITILTYAWTVSFPFVYDDRYSIVENNLVQSWRYVPGYFRGYVWQYLLPKVPPNYYRPLYFVWFRLNDALFGLNPAGWHATTILLHALATFLAYRIARSLTGRPLVAAATALVFGIHPMRAEAVAWIAGASESLLACFFFAAFLAYLHSQKDRRGRWMFISCVWYAAALLTKEPAILLPLVVFAHAWIYDSVAAPNSANWTRRVWEAAKPALCYIPVAGAYLALRVHILGAFSQPIEPLSWRVLVFSAPAVAWFYVRQWLLPVSMSEFYVLELRTRFDVPHVLAPLLALAAVTAIVWFARKKLGAREVALSGVWILAPLLPAFDVVVFPLGQTVHDRYFYLPSFGAALLVGLALDRFSAGDLAFRAPRRWLVATTILSAFLICATARATMPWSSDYAMLTHAARFAPDDPIFRTYYAQELERQGWLAYQRDDLASAEAYLERSIQNRPEAASTHFELGLVQMQEKRLDRAEQNLRTAGDLAPDEPTFYFVLGVALAREGRCVEARSQFITASSLRPGFTQAQQFADRCSLAAQFEPRPLRHDAPKSSSGR